MTNVAAAFAARWRGNARARYALNAFVGQTVFAAVSFLGSVASARLFGPAGRGELTAWVLVGTLGALVLAGPFPVGLGRAFLAGERRWIIPTALLHGLVALALAGAIVAGGALIGLDPVHLVLVVLVAVPAGVVAYDFLIVFQAAKAPWLYHGSRLVSAAVFTAGLAVLWLVAGDPSLTIALALFTTGAVLSMAVVLIVSRARFGVERMPLRRIVDRLLEAGRLGHGSYSATLLDAFLLRFDQFILLALSGRVALGIYVVGVNWAEIGQYLGHSIGQAAFEREETLDRHAARRWLVRAAASVTAFMVFITVAGFLLIGPVFGDDFAYARWVLVILAPGIVARTIAYSGAQVLLAQGKARLVSRLTLATFVIALPLWSFGASFIGVTGVAVASTLVYGSQAVFIGLQFRRRRLSPTRHRVDDDR